MSGTGMLLPCVELACPCKALSFWRTVHDVYGCYDLASVV